MRHRLVTLLALLAASAASARDEDGRLVLILAPINAQPAVVQPGDTLTAVLRANVSLRMESAEGLVSLEFISARPWRGNWMVESAIPQSSPPGAYTLVAEGPDARDTAFRAVYVLPEAPETYRVAVVSNLRAGDPDRSDSRLYRLTAALNEGAPDLVLITGDLTADGTADQFRMAIGILNDCRAPTFIVPGDADCISGLAEDFLGVYPVALRYGRDAYLLSPPSSELTAGAEARLLAERRSVRAARWSVGAATAFSLDNLRTALTLFVDDPLDYVIEDADSTAPDAAAAWGRTRTLAGPAESEIRWLTVGPRGIADAIENAD